MFGVLEVVYNFVRTLQQESNDWFDHELNKNNPIVRWQGRLF